MTAPRVALTLDGDIEATLPHPVFHSHLRILMDRRTGNVITRNFKATNWPDQNRHLVQAAREHCK